MAQVSTSTRQLNGVYFDPDGRHGWAVGGGGEILATTDAGENWTHQASSTLYNLNSVWFTDADSGWAQEISLDLDMVSAICPNCRILLVEASSSFFSDLGTAVNTAVGLGAKVVSNSYGGSESGSHGGFLVDCNLVTRFEWYQRVGLHQAAC